MNIINLKGVIRNIQPSHKIQNIEYDKADLVVARKDGKEDVLNIRFKKFVNPYKDNQMVSLKGNLRSYSKPLEDGKNKVELYVFTYFDQPELDSNDQEIINQVCLDGRICKIDPIRFTQSGKKNIHFILANNLLTNDNQKLNSYIPCVAWGDCANKIQNLSVNDKIIIDGELHSREFKKVINESTGEFEFRIAHECVIKSVEVSE